MGVVVLYHLRRGHMPGGYLGVDMFFVLSGFLITSLLLVEWDRSSRISLSSFWARRARRLLPALFLVLIAVALFAAAKVQHDELGRLRDDGIASLFYVANWRFVLSRQSYFDLFSNPSPLRHLWSLAIEEQFYLVWPLVVLACLRFGRGSRRVLSVVCTSGIVASVAAMALLYRSQDPSRAYYGTDARAHTVLIGAALALLLRSRRPAAWVSRYIGVVGPFALVACLAAFAFIADTSRRYYFGGSIAFAVVTAVVVAAAVHHGRSPVRSLLSREPLPWIGRRSYGIYLWHWPVIVYVTAARTGVHGVALDGLRVAITVGAAALSFALVEQPVRHGAFTPRLQRLVAPVAVATVFVVIVAATTAAAPPPAYLRPDVTSSSKGYSPAPLGAAKRAGMPRVYIFGDSVAFSALFAFGDALQREYGAGFAGEAHPACGMVDGLPVDHTGKPFWFAYYCNRQVPPEQLRVASQEHPDVVVWLSIWEAWDRVLGGRLYRLGTPAGDAAVTAAIDRGVARLASHGARVELLTVAPPPPGQGTENDGPPAAKYEHLNALLRAYARAHPEHVSLIDLASIVCPGGPPCKQKVDGIVLRPDGAHFTVESGRWAAQRVAPLIVRCWLDPTDPRCTGGPIASS